jgi:antitoxin (DNA-binding transcriptional repressor) of toxin-antitoxin stability system
MSKTVAAAEFQEHPLDLLEEAAEKQEELLILKDGKPLGTFVPSPDLPIRRSLEALRGSVAILGDIMEPLGEWDLTK